MGPDQKMKTIALASRSLNDAEKRYSQIEREALGIYWAVTHFHLYTYGSDFKVITDHKPLVTLFNKVNSNPPARIERWILQLQTYRFEVEYQPGKSNPADYLSRHPRTNYVNYTSCAEDYVRYIVNNAVPKTLTLKDIEIRSKEDQTLSLCRQALTTGHWHEKLQFAKSVDTELYDSLHMLFRVSEELTVCPNDVILRGNKIVIPASLQSTVIDIAHEAHQGMTKTKSLLREKVWFPKIDQMVEMKVSSCLACQSAVIDTRKEPLQMSEMPKAPWTEISVDFAELPRGGYLLVIVDDYTRYPEVELVPSTSSKAVIPVLDRVFSTFGIPEIVKTDNGPPFSSKEFSQFSAYLGFKHRKITPYWPRANGEVERLMRTLKKHLRTSSADGIPIKQGLYKFLRSYRATPHSSTKIAPAQAMFGRTFRTRIPELSECIEGDRVIRQNDLMAKDTMKRNSQKHHPGKPSIHEERSIETPWLCR